MRQIIFSVSILSFLDALTTYVLLVTGRGVETNVVIADVVNAEPASIFIISMMAAVVAVAALVVADKMIMRMPVAVGAKLRKAMYISFGVSAAWRAAVVINNALGIFVGVTPLADFFFNT
jgi:Ni,Fe-hydrogenase I cytochrome b subunit